ncbi:MAG: SpoIIE family protein phosphatase [Archangiaceae bacterium]|nr:SpoIIE family protein phosphatase [Archangiaceae bacterium]
MSTSAMIPKALEAARLADRWVARGLYTKALKRLSEALGELKELADKRWYGQGLLLAGLAHRSRGDLRQARTALTDAARYLAAEDREHSALALALAVDATIALEGLGPARAAITELARSTTGNESSGTDLARAVEHLWRGHPADAEHLSRELSGRWQAELPRRWAEALLLEARAELKREGAAAALEKAAAAAEGGELRARLYAVAALAAVQELAHAPRSAEAAAALSLARLAEGFAVSTPRWLAWAQLARGVAERAAGRSNGEKQFARAEATLAALKAPVEAGRLAAAQLTLCNALQRREQQGRMAAARDALARAGLNDRLPALTAGAEAPAASLALSSMALSTAGTVARSLVGVQVDDGVELTAVFEVNRLLSSILDTNELLQKLLDQAVKVLKAERGALLVPGEGGALVCAVARGLDPGQVTRGEADLSRSVVEQCRQTQEPVLSGNAQVDQRLRGAASVMAANIRSVLCAPLKTQKGTHGLLYLDSTSLSRAFGQHHLELLNVFCTQAAVALENAQAFSENAELNRTLEQKVDQRTLELKTANDELKGTLQTLRDTELALATAQRDALEQEMQVARSIQLAIVPAPERHVVGGVALAGHLTPATLCGGDFWTFAPLPDGSLVALVGDVTGHGVGAGMITTVARAVIDTLLRRDGSLVLEQLLSTLSDVIFDSARGKLCMTAAAVMIDPQRRRLRYASAGHVLSYLLAPPRQTPARLTTVHQLGDHLGAKIGARFETLERDYTAGDRLVLYTDGLLECTDAAGRPYGVRRLQKSLLAHAAAPAEALVDAVTREAGAYFGDTPRNDDVTLVAIELG